MMLLRVVPAVLLLALGGCGQVYNVRSLSTAYVAPSSGETARLRVVSDGMVRAVPGRACLDWNVPGAGVMVSTKPGFADRNGESLNMPGGTLSVGGGVSSELLIPANTPIAFHYLGQLEYSRQCFNSMTFVPKPGQDYLVRASIFARCSIELDQLNTENGRWTPIQPSPPGKVSMCNVMDNF